MKRLTALALLVYATMAQAQAQDTPLRVCADPDNMPLSREDGAGFENRIAELVARDLGRPLQYYWFPDRRAFVRKTLGEGHCDLIMGVPSDFDRTLNTRPYYRSSYVLIDRDRRESAPHAWSDPRLARMRLGVQLVGDDMAATPPGHALARRGIVRNVKGFPLAGDEPSGERMVQAVQRGELDGVFVWGPQAGWYARHSPVPLRITRTPSMPGLALPFEFSIAMGVRRGDKALRDALDEVIARRGNDIRAILVSYGVPLLEGER